MKSHGGDPSAHKAITLSPFSIQLQAKDLVTNNVRQDYEWNRSPRHSPINNQYWVN